MDQHLVLSAVERGLVAHSFGLILLARPRIAADFYARLFARAPALRPLFPSDLAGQQQKFLDMLGVVAAALDDPAPLLTTLQTLGAAHRGYGVPAEAYPLAGQVWLETMAAALGSFWTPELAAAWAALYRWLEDVMLAGAAHR